MFFRVICIRSLRNIHVLSKQQFFPLICLLLGLCRLVRFILSPFVMLLQFLQNQSLQLIDFTSGGYLQHNLVQSTGAVHQVLWSNPVRCREEISHPFQLWVFGAHFLVHMLCLCAFWGLLVTQSGALSSSPLEQLSCPYSPLLSRLAIDSHCAVVTQNMLVSL